jgi:basic membrane lipoprotein Med (substrate-binding protein (PBP1-ABC) superfamily)
MLASVLSLLALAATACGGGEGGSEGQNDATERPFRVALLTSGPVSDAGWYAGAYEGLLQIRDSVGAQISHQQTRTPAEFDEAFLSYAAGGFDLVFAHGFEYQDAAIRIGQQFPDLTIVVSAGGRVARNVNPLIFKLEEGSYLAGMVAGAMSRTGTVGMVGGVEIPPAKGTFLAFEAGARSVRPETRVLQAFIGNWDDVAAAKEAAVAQIRRGADVIIHNTDAASFGVFQAVREASREGADIWALGMNRDQNDVAPDVILGSAVIRIPQAFVEVARAYRSGGLEGRPYYTGLAVGVVDFVPNPELAHLIPAEVLKGLDRARADIAAGTLKVPRVPFVEGESEGR